MLDRRRRGIGRASALDHVRIQGPLREEAGIADRLRLVPEHIDERMTNLDPLLLRIAHAVKRLEEPL